MKIIIYYLICDQTKKGLKMSYILNVMNFLFFAICFEIF